LKGGRRTHIDEVIDIADGLGLFGIKDVVSAARPAPDLPLQLSKRHFKMLGGGIFFAESVEILVEEFSQDASRANR
jgi:hypothetical protein